MNGPVMTRSGLWGFVDALAHALYNPTLCGRSCAVTRWHHCIHLIPRRWQRWACDRYDRALGVTEKGPA